LVRWFHDGCHKPDLEELEARVKKIMIKQEEYKFVYENLHEWVRHKTLSVTRQEAYSANESQR
jgi:hypothetical protein